MFGITLLCLCSLAYTSLGLTILPVEDGVLVKRNLPVRIKIAEWRVALTLDDPSEKVITTVFRETNIFRRMVKAIPANLSRVTRKSHWLREIDRADRWLHTLVPRQARNRRAILGIIGQISHDLFGTVTSNELEELTNRVMENRNSLQKVINFDEELLTIVNITQEEMKRNQETINEIINVTGFIQDQIATIVRSNEVQNHALITYNIIHEKMNLIWRHIQELQRIIDEFGSIKHALEQGRLDEYLLSSMSLRQILKRHDFPSAGMVMPIEWY